MGSTTSMRKVMCTGTFDGIHPGHLDYFRQAKEQGDFLVVVVAREKNVLKEKGKKPRLSEKERYEMIAVHPLVDKALLGNEEDKLKVVEREQPDVICIGYDQQVNETQLKKELAKRKLFPIIFRAKAYHPEKYKSSILSP